MSRVLELGGEVLMMKASYMASGADGKGEGGRKIEQRGMARRIIITPQNRTSQLIHH